jgi:site-specific DNA-adenine methylase
MPLTFARGILTCVCWTNSIYLRGKMTTNLKSLKTPLRYPGGKSRAIKYLDTQLPKGFTEFRETFLGGGSMALHITKQNPDVKVWVNDKYYNLYNFWVQLRDNGERLHEELLRIKTPMVYRTKELRKNKVPKDQWDQSILDNIQKHRELFNKAKVDIKTADDFTKAVLFYILNKCSFSGLGETSSFSAQASEQNFSVSGIDKLPTYSRLIQNWKITNLDYDEVLNAPSNEKCFVFLDPPYDIKDNLYGKNGNMHSGFDHMRFFNDVDKCRHDWMITYNSNEVLRERFSDYSCNDWDLTYTMRSTGNYLKDQKDRKELLVTSYKR